MFFKKWTQIWANLTADKTEVLVPLFLNGLLINDYLKVASSNTSRLEAHAGFFRLLMKEIFDHYVPFDKKLIS